MENNRHSRSSSADELNMPTLGSQQDSSQHQHHMQYQQQYRQQQRFLPQYRPQYQHQQYEHQSSPWSGFTSDPSNSNTFTGMGDPYYGHSVSEHSDSVPATPAVIRSSSMQHLQDASHSNASRPAYFAPRQRYSSYGDLHQLEEQRMLYELYEQRQHYYRTPGSSISQTDETPLYTAGSQRKTNKLEDTDTDLSDYRSAEREQFSRMHSPPDSFTNGSDQSHPATPTFKACTVRSVTGLDDSYPQAADMNSFTTMNRTSGSFDFPRRASSDPLQSYSAISAYLSKARASPSPSFPRQITLSTIPSNQIVPIVPGKLASKSGKVRIQLTFDRPFFNAGGEISGRLEIQCSSSNSVQLADVAIELLGYEATTMEQMSPKVFHKTTIRLQDSRHPSQAVYEQIDPDSEGYWQARKGRTFFPFRLNLQDTLPNSYDSKVGHVRYIASAIVGAKGNRTKEVLNHSREVFIYETWTTDDISLARQKSVKADTSKRLFMGGDGSLEMYAELTRTMVSSGGIVYVVVSVKNLTKKKILGIKVSLSRHLAVTCPHSNQNNQSITGIREQDAVKSYSEMVFKGEDYSFESDDPRTVVLPVYIPSGVYSLRNTKRLHAQIYVQVSLMVSMSKALTVELPVYVTHASSWSDPPPRIPRDFLFPMHNEEPVKKNKTGVFTKKKASNSFGSNNFAPGRSSDDNQSSSIYSGSQPISNSRRAAPRISDPTGIGSNNAYPYSRRSSQKEPDSPTSIINFSQAGSLFVVNPDSQGYISGPESGPTRRSVEYRPAHATTRSESDPSACGRSSTFPSFEVARIPNEERSKESAGPSNAQPFIETYSVYESGEPVQSPPHSNLSSPTKKENEKSRPDKLGLRKAIAKLSISIPSHNSSGSNSNRHSKSSPNTLPSTPRSLRSLKGADDLPSPDSRSPGGSLPLSRKSSVSSMGSFRAKSETYSRKSSIGSLRFMPISPSNMSPDFTSDKQTLPSNSTARSTATLLPTSYDSE